MESISDERILELDEQYALAGVPFHARPLQAAVDILGGSFSLGIFSNPSVKLICKAYERLVPEVVYTWPGMGTGLIASVDRVKAVKVGVGYGMPKLTPHEMLGFPDHATWEVWCRNKQQIAARSMYAFADIFDLVYGIDDCEKLSPGRGPELLGLAASHLAMATHSLEQTGTPWGSQLQPIHLTAELSLKGALVQIGVEEKELSKREYGHNLAAIAEKLIAERPHSDDQQLLAVAEKMPGYVDNRYRGSKLSRLEVIDLALGAQFIAGSAVRRVSQRDIGSIFEVSDWPGPRHKYF